jgi:methyl-accepting chemotaxis protein
MTSFNNLSLRVKVLSVAGIALALMIAVASVVYAGIQASQERESWVEHAHRVLGLTDALQLDLINMETGERGFLLTGDEAFLEPYNMGTQNYRRHLADVQALVADNRDQLATLRDVEMRVGTWQQQLVIPLIARRREVTSGQSTMADISRIVGQGLGKQHLDGIRAKLGEFREVELALLDTRRLESEAAARSLQTTLIAGTLAALLLSLGAAVLISGSIAKRLGQVATAATGIAAGRLDERYALPEGRDEVGVLAGAFSTMTANLRAARDAEAQARAAEERRNQDERRARTELQRVVGIYSAFISRVAAGDLSSRVAVEGDAELQRIGQDLNSMVASLHALMSQVQQANSSIAAAAAEILAATTQQAAAAAEQSAAITQTSTTIEEVKAIALQTAQQSQQVAHESQTALDVARQGTQAVEDTVASMTQIRDRVANIAQTILSLAEQTQAISAITNTVTDLADQSNLLALNAAIEAARAGEQGKSFAVVAQHVRELAERSKAATSQVSEILRDIQQATNAAVLVTEDGSKGVDSGAQLAGQAGQVIHRIAREVEHGAQANVQMAAAAQQQTVGMEQIGQAMGSIQQATTQALASTRQAERAAQDLYALAQSLQQAVAIYRL